MENSIFSDMPLIEPANRFPKKAYMPHKQIGFFDDKYLKKNIVNLKNNINQKEDFLKTFTSLDKIKDYMKKNRYRVKKVVDKQEKEKIDQEKAINNEEEKIKIEKEKLTNVESEGNMEEDKITKTKIKFEEKKSNEEIKESKFTKNSYAGTDKNLINLMDNKQSKTNFNSDRKEVKSIKIITLGHKSVKFNRNSNDNNDLLNKSKTTNNTNIIKNKIISNHLNKDVNNDHKVSDTSSLKGTVYSGISPPNVEEEEKKSIYNAKKDNISINYNRNPSMDLNQISFYTNKNLKKVKKSPQKEIVDSKVDFVYKKIFDKKSRYLFNNKQPSQNNENRKKPKSKADNSFSNDFFYNKLGCGFKKRQYIEDKILDIKRKIFFIKGVYDFSYPKIIVNKIKTAQDFYNAHNTENKIKLRDSMNNTSQKFFQNYEEKLKNKTEDFRKSFYVEKLNTNPSIKTDKDENDNEYYDFNDKMFRSTYNIDFKPLKKSKLTLTNRFMTPEERNPIRVINPINIQTIYPDLGEPSKLKVIHKSKIL